MKKQVSFFVAMFTLLLFLNSCSMSRQVAYFQNADEISLAASKMLYDAKIMPKDQLTITVITSDPLASAPFNLSVSNTVGTSGQLGESGGSGFLQAYLVDNNGNINFPVVGRIHVAGLTKTQCEDLIKIKVAPYLASSEKPIVTVRMASYRVTLIGEVSRPGVIPVTTEKMSVIEAIASAGDLTIYGKRNNIMLIREDVNGEKSIHRLNLNDANLINSPYFYLQQNDILYVEPNKVKARSSSIGSTTSIWFSVVGIVTSLSSLLVNIGKLVPKDWKVSL